MGNGTLEWLSKQEFFMTVYLEPCFFIYVNDPPDNLTSNPNLFADNTVLNSTVTDANAAANHINNDSNGK